MAEHFVLCEGGADVSDDSQKLLKGRPLRGMFMDAVHDKITQLVGVAAILNILHGIHEEVLIYGEVVEVVAIHALPNRCDFQHGQSHHEDLIVTAPFQRIEQLYPQELQLLRG